ncbi:MAG TPA: glutaredoxin family protein [Opitutales bacterium]|nr:glutaredoxin family protein [Opitutales bacterium]
MKVTIYTKTGCPWAAGAKAFLTAKGIPFEERNMTEEPSYKSEAESATGQSSSPTLNIDGSWVPDAGLTDINDALQKKAA